MPTPATSLPPLTYLSFDSLAEGVGVSQVLPYVERLGQRGLTVTIDSYEIGAPSEAVAKRLADVGVTWRPHAFGRGGAAGGVARVARAARYITGARLVHARADLAAASALLGRCGPWVWDVRAFWREERINQGMLRPGSPEERVLRTVESRAARASAGIITLTQRAIDILDKRHGAGVAAKARVVTTCADLERFTPGRPPPPDPLRLLLAGTLNRLYDVPTTIRFLQRVRARRPAELTVLSPPGGPWDADLEAAGVAVGHVPPADMPAQVRSHHVGLSLRSFERPISSAAATPTKLGEYLACGLPVVVSPGLGDMDSFVRRYECGVVVEDPTDDGLDRAARELDRVLEDPATGTRCRSLAEEHFNLDRGVDQLIAAYGAALG
ncbi:MAG: glycosyltransferase family protein [Acidimicrobiales bacterium]